jgi:tetratricopeptide (TPR) repeat protein
VSPALRQLFINQLSAGIELVGPQFEAFGQIMIDAISPVPVVHAGLNPLGHPVGHVVDSLASDGSVVAEYTSDENSFVRPYRKLKSDCEHARTTQPNAKTVYLVSSRECGPKARSQLTRMASVLARNGVTVEIYDRVRLATYIVDRLLLDEEAAGRLEPLLGPLALIRTQYAASNLVPLEQPGYRARPLVLAELNRRLAAHPVVVICGISGAGKSELAAEAARAAKGRYDCVLWCRAADLASVAELASVYVERRGRSANFRSLLEAGRCLLVLDDLNPRITAAALAPLCGPESNIIVTRQVGSPTDFKIPLLLREEAVELLNAEMTVPCPPDIADLVWNTVGGHPLALRLIRSSAQAASWNDAASDCIAIGDVPDEGRTQRLADRLLDRIAAPLAKHIALFQWCRAHRVDRNWARFCLGHMTPFRLEEYCLLAADRLDVFRLHDIFGSVILSRECSAEFRELFERKIAEYIAKLAECSEEDINFHNFCAVHRPLLTALAVRSANPRPFLYCLLQTAAAEELPLELIGDPTRQVAEIVRQTTITPLDVFESIEAIEVLYRRKKAAHDADEAKEFLRSALPLFDQLSTAPGFPSAALPRLRHHQAKALRNVGDLEGALRICYEVIALPDPPPAARLLFGRLLAPDKEQSDRAATEFRQILIDAQSTPSKNEINVVLSAFTELNRVSTNFRENWRDFGPFVTATTLDAAARGLDLAYDTIANLATKLQQHDAATLCALFSKLPPRPDVNELSRGERESWGRILLTVGLAEGSPERRRLRLEEAVQCFRSVEKPSNFILKETARALNHLHRAAEAKDLILTIPQPKWSAYEHLEYALALAGLNDAQAVAAIHRAVVEFDRLCENAAKHESYRPMFLEAQDSIARQFRA